MAVFAPRTEKSRQFPELQSGPWAGSMEQYADGDIKSITKWWTDPGASCRLRGRTGLYACIFFAFGKKGYRFNPLRVPYRGFF
jgi:hypothetical protein